MNIMFWVTEKCNLNCDYCYVNKKPKTMSLETAGKAFDYFKKKFENVQFQKGEIHIGFHGGEPLLNFPVIHFLTEALKKEYGDKIRYFSLTTNGTIYDKKMFDYLMDNIELSVSIDGNRETNDLKRHHYNGSSAYDETIATLEFLKVHKTNVRVRMTVNKETIKDFANNFIELQRRQYGIVAYAINMDDFWDADDIREYGRQLNRIMDYYIAEDPEESKYFLYNLKEATFRARTLCDGGTTNFHISPEGDIYPCILSVGDKEFKLGDIINGVDRNALQRLHDINKLDIAGCERCNFQGHCSSQVCKIINKKSTGDYYKAPYIACQERKVIYDCYEKYKYILEGFDA